MAYVFNPSGVDQFVGGGLNKQNNPRMVGMEATSSSSGRRWNLRYRFTVPIQMSRIDVVFNLTRNLSGPLSVGLTDDENTITPNDAQKKTSGAKITHTWDRNLEAGKTYYLWLNYRGSMFEYANCTEGSVTITATPAASTLSAENGVLGEEQKLIITAGSSEFTHDILYQVGESSGEIAKNSNAAEVLWTPPVALAAENTGGKSVDCTFTVVTYISGKENARSTTTVTYSIPESCSPALGASFTPVNEGLSSQFDGIFIQGRSKLKARYIAEFQYGATLSGFDTKIGNATVQHSASEYISDVLGRAGTLAVSGRVTDSRGFNAEVDESINVEEYAAPVVIPVSEKSAIICQRCNADGVLDSRGLHLRIEAGKKFSAVAGSNKCLLRYRLAEMDGVFSDWITLLDKGSKETEIRTTTSDTLQETKGYTVEIGVLDDIGESATIVFYISTLDVPLHLGAGGKNIGVGRYCDYHEPYRVDVGWDIRLDTGVRIYPFPGEEKEVVNALIPSEGITRSKLAADALYSPIAPAVSKPITAADIGKTIRTSWNTAATYTLTQENSAQIPVGAEIAVLFWGVNDADVLIQASGGVKLVVSGETTVKADNSVKISQAFGMLAIKKVETNSSTGDAWLVTGNVEVVS